MYLRFHQKSNSKKQNKNKNKKQKQNKTETEGNVEGSTIAEKIPKLH